MTSEEMVPGANVKTPQGFCAWIYLESGDGRHFVFINGVGMDGPYTPEELQPA